MQYQEARLRSFTTATIKPKGRSKAKPTPTTWPLSPTKYPNLTPENLAYAGYYYAPLADDLDQCGCFLCDSKLGGWDEGDDPFEEHYRRGKCGWAMAVCSVMVDERRGGGSGKQTGKARWVDPIVIATTGTEPFCALFRLLYEDADRLPQCDTMNKARIKTFAKWWPHPIRGWSPTPTSVSRPVRVTKSLARPDHYVFSSARSCRIRLYANGTRERLCDLHLLRLQYGWLGAYR
jgi:hypothetical protein